MRHRLAASLVLCLSSVLPAAAATCPGNVVFQDSFASATKALDQSSYPQSKLTVQGGKAIISLLQAGKTRIEEYWGARYGDVNVCVTVDTVATEKPENQIGALIFWAIATLLWEGKRYVDRLLPFDGTHRGHSRVRRS